MKINILFRNGITAEFGDEHFKSQKPSRIMLDMHNAKSQNRAYLAPSALLVIDMSEVIMFGVDDEKNSDSVS